MDNNEDYLDSLLKQMEQNDSPDSALNKVREMSQSVDNNNPAIDVVLNSEDTVSTSIDDILATLTGEENVTDEPISFEEKIVDEVIDESMTETINTIDSETSVETDRISLDDLLKSDFSGEIELDENEIDKLLNDSDNNDSDMSDETVSESLTQNESEENSEDNSEDNSVDNSEDNSSVVNLEDLLVDISNENEQDVNDNATDNLDFSENDINDMLEKASMPEGEVEIDMEDLASLESEFGIYEKDDNGAIINESGELDDISSLLSSIDNAESEMQNSDDEMLDLLNDAVNVSMEEDKAEEERKEKEKEAKEASDALKKGKKKKKEKKIKKAKEEASVDSLLLDSEKKKNFFVRLLEFLTATDEDDESLIKTSDVAQENGFEDIKGENKEILDEIDKEGEEKGKKKKKKDKKGKKGKKGKGEEPSESDDGESEEEAPKKKKKKEKKEKKPLELDIDTGKPLSKKNVKLIFILCLSILIAILLFLKFIPGAIQKSQARNAFYKGDYEKTYTTFFGEKLSDSDQILFNRAEILLKVRHKYDAYVAYKNLNMRVEALDQLLQAVSKYEAWLIIAETNGVSDSFKAEYNNILIALLNDFNVTEEDAKAINALPTNLEYSLKCDSVANGTDYIDPNEPLPGPFVPPASEDSSTTYVDILPEETY